MNSESHHYSPSTIVRDTATITKHRYEFLCRCLQRNWNPEDPHVKDRLPFQGLNAPEFDDANFHDRQETKVLLVPPQMMEGIYVCRTCGSKKTQSLERQMRSSDEPMSIMVTCMNCRKTWTVKG